MKPGDDARRREADEPEEAPRNVPWAITLLTVGVAVWGTGYFWMYAGDGAVSFGDGRSVAALQAPVVVEGASVNGEEVFKTRCAACHQLTGAGVAGAFPPLAASEWVLGDPNRPIAIVQYGLQGAITVAGTEYVSAMPPQPLDDAEVAAVLTYVRASWGNKAEPVTAAQSAAIRKQLGERGMIEGGVELQKLFP